MSYEDLYRMRLEKVAQRENEQLRVVLGTHLRADRYDEKQMSYQEEIAMKKIVEVMKRRAEWTSGEISKHTGLKQATVQVWLWELKKKGLVDTKKHEQEQTIRLWYTT